MWPIRETHKETMWLFRESRRATTSPSYHHIGKHAFFKDQGYREKRYMTLHCWNSLFVKILLTNLNYGIFFDTNAFLYSYKYSWNRLYGMDAFTALRTNAIVKLKKVCGTNYVKDYTYMFHMLQNINVESRFKQIKFGNFSFSFHRVHSLSHIQW